MGTSCPAGHNVKYVAISITDYLHVDGMVIFPVHKLDGFSSFDALVGAVYCSSSVWHSSNTMEPPLHITLILFIIREFNGWALAL